MPQDPQAGFPRARVCAVLAGGRASRLGGNKALARLAGRPLVSHMLELVAAADLEGCVVAKPATELAEGAALEGPVGAHGDAQVIREPAEPTHPLAGIAAALAHFGEPLVVVPCDLPLLPATLLAHLASRGEPNATLIHGGRMQPLVGRYSPSAAAVLLDAARAGRPAHEAVAQLDPSLLGTEQLAKFGDPDLYLRGANTPAELARLEALLSGPGARGPI